MSAPGASSAESVVSAEGGKCLALFAGPSGGHLFPALAFAETFKQKFPSSSIHLITGKKAGRFARFIDAPFLAGVHYLPDFPFPAGISLKTLRFLLQLAQAFVFSYRIIAKLKPELCVGFGSYAAFPGLRIAAFRRIPVLIHEQNRIPGKATQWLARHADAVAVSFDETFRGKNLPCREVVGLPLRSGLRKTVRKPDPKNSSPMFHILIMGGSQGAHRLNTIVLDALAQVSSEEKSRIAVTHIAGDKDCAWVAERYLELGIQAEAYSFYSSMDELFARTNLAVTRAGANTLFELALWRIPAIVIPYPHAGSHQKANAEYFAAHEAVMTGEEVLVDGAWLFKQIERLRRDAALLERMSQNMARLAEPKADQKLVQVAENLLEKERACLPQLRI